MSVDLIRHSGDDELIASAARVSTGTDMGSKKPIGGLLNFLMRDRHGSPFEHGSMTFRIEAPIFVAREFFRHRIGWSYNEESGRYKELEPVFYIPNETRNLIQVGKPGAYTFEPGTEEQHELLGDTLSDVYREAYEGYSSLLVRGVAREVARVALPVGIYTSFYATCNPRSLMHFLSLRTKSPYAKVPSFPQEEIQNVAFEIENIFHQLFPMTLLAFNAHGRVAP